MTIRHLLALALAGSLAGLLVSCATVPAFDPQCATGNASVLAGFDGAARGECRVSSDGTFTLVISPEDPPHDLLPCLDVVGNRLSRLNVWRAHIERHCQRFVNSPVGLLSFSISPTSSS